MTAPGDVPSYPWPVVVAICGGIAALIVGVLAIWLLIYVLRRKAAIDLPYKLTPVGNGAWWIDGPEGRWGKYDHDTAQDIADRHNGEWMREHHQEER